MDTVTRLNHMVVEYETEITMLRARVVKFDEERARDQGEMERLKGEIDRLRTVRPVLRWEPCCRLLDYMCLRPISDHPRTV